MAEAQGSCVISQGHLSEGCKTQDSDTPAPQHTPLPVVARPRRSKFHAQGGFAASGSNSKDQRLGLMLEVGTRARSRAQFQEAVASIKKQQQQKKQTRVGRRASFLSVTHELGWRAPRAWACGPSTRRESAAIQQEFPTQVWGITTPSTLTRHQTQTFARQVRKKDFKLKHSFDEYTRTAFRKTFPSATRVYNVP
jgi:hypothetical protein